MMTSRPRLILATMLIYVAHPAFIFYHNQIITESLSISLGVIYTYYLVKYIKTGQTKYVWLFHLLMLILIFIKPAFLILLAASAILFLYILLFRRHHYSWRSCFLSCALACLIIAGYMSALNKKYDVWGISSVTDINYYWMMRKCYLMDTIPFENEAHLAEFNTHTFDHPNSEAFFILNNYGWKEFHTVVQNSLKQNHKVFLTNRWLTYMRTENLKETVGIGSVGNAWKIATLLCGITFYQLFALLIFYSLLIAYSLFKSRKIPIISLIFLTCIVLNLLSILLAAPNDYGRLIVPTIPMLLLVIMQISEWIIDVIKKKANQFQLQ
jgi:hypothetical protein